MTPKQKHLLTFMADYFESHDGVMPTLDEMRVAIGQKSKSGVHIMLKRLEVDGHIKRGASYRNITIVNFPFRPGKERAIWHLEKAFQHLSGYHGYGGAVARHGIESVVAILNGKVESAA